MTRRPKLLFLAYYFPPFPTVASVRAANIAKHLSLLGWELSVVTPHPSLIRAPEDLDGVTAEMDRLHVGRVYTGHRWRCLSSGFLKRSYRGIGWFAGGICRRIARTAGIPETAGWLPEACRACAQLTPDDVDVILATGSPWVSFRLAGWLGRKLGRPFVLDYRDLWTAGNPHIGWTSTGRNQRVEARLLADSAAVSVVSPSMASSLAERFGVGAKTRVITNGYDPADLEDVKPLDFGHFAIVYTGLLYPPKAHVMPVMLALRRLSETTPDRSWRFHYYGPHTARVHEAASTHGLLERVVIHGVVSRRECLAAVRGAGAAVVITSVYETASLGDRGILTGKIFEAIGLGTPVLVIGPHGSDVETVIHTTGNGRVFSGADIDGMAAFLLDLMRGKAPPSKNPEGYSWPRLIREMDAMLREAASLPTGATTAEHRQASAR